MALEVGVLGEAAAGAVLAMYGAFHASRSERQRPMAGDSIIPVPMYSATQAVTIDAPPERGGWYTSDVLARRPRPLPLALASVGHCVRQNQQLRGIRRRTEAG